MFIPTKPILSRIAHHHRPIGSGARPAPAHSTGFAGARFESDQQKTLNPFVWLFDGIGQGWKKFTSTKPGQQVSKGLGKINGWLQATPKTQQPAKPVKKPDAPKKPSPFMTKLKQNFKKLKLTLKKLNTLKYPFTWAFEQIAKGWRWFIGTRIGKQVDKGLSKVNGWLQASRKNGNQVNSKSTSSSKSTVKPSPPLKPLTEQEVRELEELEVSPFMAKLEKMPIEKLKQLSKQKKDTLKQLTEEKDALGKTVKELQWQQKQAQTIIQRLQLEKAGKPELVKANINQRQKALLEDEKRFQDQVALKKSALETAERQLTELNFEINQIAEREWAKRQIEPPST